MKLVAGLILFTIAFSSHAEDVFDIAEKYNKKKNQVLDLESNKRKVLADIYKIEKETKSLVIKKAELDEEKAALDHRLSKISKDVVEIENELTELTPVLMDRLAFVEQINDLPWFYAFLTSQTVGELDRLVFSAKNMNESQVAEVNRFVELHAKLESQKKELTLTATQIVQLKKEILDQEKQVEKNQKVKSGILKRLERRISRNKVKLNSIKKAGRKAIVKSDMHELSLLFGTDFFDKKGKLQGPIQGPLTHEYGINKYLSKDQVQLFHKGHFYSVPQGTKVKTIGAGNVRFAGRIKGYGKALIVDHGGRYYTTYANLKKLKVKKGQVLKAQQVIGQTGNHHLQFAQGLYFEIRHFSEPQDPAKWLKGPSDQLATL